MPCCLQTNCYQTRLYCSSTLLRVPLLHARPLPRYSSSSAGPALTPTLSRRTCTCPSRVCPWPAPRLLRPPAPDHHQVLHARGLAVLVLVHAKLPRRSSTRTLQSCTLRRSQTRSNAAWSRVPHTPPALHRTPTPPAAPPPGAARVPARAARAHACRSRQPRAATPPRTPAPRIRPPRAHARLCAAARSGREEEREGGREEVPR
jgi:hypothetical protein